MLEKIVELMEPYKTEKKELNSIRGGEFLKIADETIFLKNKVTIQRDRLIKRHEKDIVTIPETTDHKFVLVIQPRPATKQGVSIEFPAGYVEKNESMLEAGKRELLEETGYIAQEMISVTSYYQDVACCSNYKEMFHAKNCQKVCEQKLDESEMITFIELSYEELLEIFNQNFIVDVNTTLGIFYLMKEHKK